MDPTIPNRSFAFLQYPMELYQTVCFFDILVMFEYETCWSEGRSVGQICLKPCSLTFLIISRSNLNMGHVGHHPANMYIWDPQGQNLGIYPIKVLHGLHVGFLHI